MQALPKLDLPIRLWSTTPRRVLPQLFTRIFLVAVLIAASYPAAAQGRKLRLIRDAEIETLLRDYAAPIFGAAGITSRGSMVIIVNERAFNAFVAGGSRMFITSGALLEAETPNEIIGVLAHETGHLAGGHLQGLHAELARAQAIGLLTTLLGMGAAIAAGGGAGTQAGMAAAQIGPRAAMRSLLTYRRGQELAADRAALTYLDATKQSAQGMIRTFRRFADQMLFSSQYADPYAQSHPMPNQRIAQLETTASKSPYWEAKDSPNLQLRHDMARAKLNAFMRGGTTVGKRYPKRDKSLPARYARAIVAYRSGSLRSAIRQIDDLIREHPNYPYFHELKGQAYLEAGKPGQAIAPLQKAASLAPRPGLIQVMLGHALLETNKPGNLAAATAALRKGLNAEPLSADGYRHLATALARQDRIPDAEVATARGLMIEGDVKAAKNYAKRAQAKLKRGSPGWLQAEDIISYKPPKSKK